MQLQKNPNVYRYYTSSLKISLIFVVSVPKNGLILPVAFMGAPSVHVEKLTSGSELQVAAEKMQELLNCNEEGIVLADSVREVDIQSNTVRYFLLYYSGCLIPLIQ